MKINKEQALQELRARLKIFRALLDLSKGEGMDLEPLGYIEDFDIIKELQEALKHLIATTEEHIKLQEQLTEELRQWIKKTN